MTGIRKKKKTVTGKAGVLDLFAQGEHGGAALELLRRELIRVSHDTLKRQAQRSIRAQVCRRTLPDQQQTPPHIRQHEQGGEDEESFSHYGI
jgi:hypothetical protein